MNRLDGDAPVWLKDTLRGNVPSVQCACGRVALDPISDTRNGFVGRLRPLPDSLGAFDLRLNNDPASQRRRHLSILMRQDAPGR
jgi:hypothetical protein